ncbi:MAG: T9SS type A sorting domain-containing protein, partial [Bacteroidota bacterium]
RFSDLGSKVDAYVLQGVDHQSAAGWLLANEYNHTVVPRSGPPAAISGASLHLQNLVDTTYRLRWYNCLSGAIVGSESIEVVNGELHTLIPDFVWDLAFVLDRDDPVLSSLGNLIEVQFALYPNPAIGGEAITLEVDQFEGQEGSIELWDASGRTISREDLRFSGQQSFRLPANLSQGIYWIKVEAANQSGTKAILIQ